MPQFIVNVPTPGTPVQASVAQKECRCLTLIAAKTIAGPTASPNTGKVRVGFSPNSGQQPLELAVGGTQQVAVGAGCFDLSCLYVDAVNAGDGVILFYV
jgi:hypothetical protein